MQGFVPLSSVECPGLLLNYDYLALELLGVDPVYPSEKNSRATCDKILAQRFLTRVSRIAYPLLEVHGRLAAENADEVRVRVQRAYHGTPGKRGRPDSSTGVTGTLRMLEELLETGKPFACGEKPCIADLSVVPPLLLLNVAGCAELLSPSICKYVQRFEDFFGSKYQEMKAPVEAWVDMHKPRVEELGITVAR